MIMAFAVCKYASCCARSDCNFLIENHDLGDVVFVYGA